MISKKWPTQPLGQICLTSSGGTPSRSQSKYFGGGIPWVKSGDLTDGDVMTCEETITEEALSQSSAKLFRKGTVLVAMYGATVGKLGLLGMDATTNQAVCGISVPEELDRIYLFYFLLSQRASLIEKSTGGAQPNISQKIIRELNVPMPPIAEQLRIVDILSRANGIVRLRREAEKKAAELIPALFLDMFGDPATNSKGWTMVAFGDVGECRLGKMLDKQKQSGDFQLPYLRNVNVQWNRIDIYDLLTMDFHPDEQAKFRLQKGDILICEGGEVGRAAIWNGQMDECYYQKALHRLRPNLEMVRPDFIVCLLWHLARTGALLGASTHATIAHLTGVQLKAMKIICPPVALQNQFEQFADRCKSIQSQQASAFSTAQATFNALMAQVFQG
jgi:type I restriction enzyme S subunit